MGEKDERENGSVRADVKTPAGDRAGGKSASSASSAGRAGGSGRTAGSTEEKQSAEAVRVSEVKSVPAPKDVPVSVPTANGDEAKKEKARQRQKAYRERKKKEAVTKAQPETFTGEQLSDVLVSLSGIVAARPNMTHWQLSKEEANQIMNPLTNIIKKNTKIEDLEKYSDGIALTVACVSVLLPRVIITGQMAQHEKALKKGVMNNGQNGTVSVRRERIDGQHGEANHEQPRRADDRDDENDIRAAIPALAY